MVLTSAACRTGTRLITAVAVMLLAAACGRSLPPAPVIFGKPAADQPVQTARLPAPVPPKPAVRLAPVGRIVIARKGETLYTISRRHGVSLRTLIDINRLRPPFTLSPGRRLILPVPRSHAVAKGETVYGIARKYGVSMSELVRTNRIRPPYHIPVGRRLSLPVATPLRTASRAPSGGQWVRPSPSRAVPYISPRPTRTRAEGTIREPPPRAGRGFQWPLRGRIIVAFGPRGGGLHNDGINILARSGSAVRAAENGVVAYAGNELQGFGNLVLIKHAGGWMTAYAHVGRLIVRRGQRVRRGQTIARVGRTGNVSRPQLHFEIRRGDQPVNPIKFLARV